MTRPVLLIAILAIVVYLPSVVTGEFLQYDDDHYVVHSPAVQKLEVGRALDPRGHREDLGAEYLPVRDLTYMLDAKLFGTSSPRAFRATNLAWYALACALAYLLLVETTKNAALSFLAAALFAVHPVHAESVAWIASRKDVLGGALGFAALLAHARGWLVSSLVLALLAMLSKSTMLCLPLLVPLVERRLSWRFLLHVGVAAVVAWNAVEVGRRTGIAHPLPPGGYFAIFCTDAPILVRYLSISFVPVGLRVCYAPYFHQGLDPIVVASLSVLAVAAAAAAWRREMRFGAAWFALAAAPVLNVQPGSQWIAERYLFVPLLGVCVILAAVLLRVASVAPRLSVALASLSIALLATLGVARGLDFTTQQRLFRSNVRLEPGDPVVHHELARGLLAKAEKSLADGKAEAVAPLARAAELEEREAIGLAALAPFALPDGWLVEASRCLARDYELQEKHLESTRTWLDVLRFLDARGLKNARKRAETVGSKALAHARDESDERDVALLLEAARCFAFARQDALAKAAVRRVNRTHPELVERAAARDPDLARALQRD